MLFNNNCNHYRYLMNKDLNKINKELLKFFEKYKDNIPEKDLENFNKCWAIIHNYLV